MAAFKRFAGYLAKLVIESGKVETATATAVRAGAGAGIVAGVGAGTVSVTGDGDGAVPGAGNGTLNGAIFGAVTCVCNRAVPVTVSAVAAVTGLVTGGVVGAVKGAGVGAVTGAAIGTLNGALIGAATVVFNRFVTGPVTGSVTVTGVAAGAVTGSVTGAVFAAVTGAVTVAFRKNLKGILEGFSREDELEVEIVNEAEVQKIRSDLKRQMSDPGVSAYHGKRSKKFQLSISVYHELCKNLNVGEDYKKLAELMGYTIEETKTFGLSENAAHALLSDWGITTDNDVNKLVGILKEMGRHDLADMLEKRAYHGEKSKISDLSISVYHELCRELNKPKTGKDYKELAEQMEYTIEKRSRFELEKNPAHALLSDWGTKTENDVKKLVSILKEMRRDDLADMLVKRAYHGERSKISELSISVYHELCKNLNVGKDYEKLAGLMGYTIKETKTFELSENAAHALLSDWGITTDNDVKKLVGILKEMGRHDLADMPAKRVHEQEALERCHAVEAISQPQQKQSGNHTA